MRLSDMKIGDVQLADGQRANALTMQVHRANMKGARLFRLRPISGRQVEVQRDA